MADTNTTNILSAVNQELGVRYSRDDPVSIGVEGRPKYRIATYKPLVVEKYGIIRNRAPYLMGNVVLRGFLTEPHADGWSSLYAAVDAGLESYGFHMDVQGEGFAALLKLVGSQLDMPELNVESVHQVIN